MNIQEKRGLKGLREETVELMRRRENQDLKGPWEAISNFTKCLFYCLNPCLNYSVVVDRNHEYIVSVAGVPTKILRAQGSYAGYGKLKKIDIRIYVIMLTQLVSDKQGMPFIVEVQLRYRIADSLQASYLTENFHNFINKKAKEVVFEVLSHSDRISWNSERVKSQLKNTLDEKIQEAGLKVDTIFVQKAVYEINMQRQLMIKQEADSYILATKAICKASRRNLKELLKSYSEQGIELSDEEVGLLTMKMIQQNVLKPTSIDFYQFDQNTVVDPLLPITMKKE